MQSLCNTVQPYFLKAGFNPNREASVYVVFFSRWLNIASIWKKSAMRYFFGNDPAWNENTSSRKVRERGLKWCDHFCVITGLVWSGWTKKLIVGWLECDIWWFPKMEENNKGFCRFHVSRHFPKMEENNKGFCCFHVSRHFPKMEENGRK